MGLQMLWGVILISGCFFIVRYTFTITDHNVDTFLSSRNPRDTLYDEDELIKLALLSPNVSPISPGTATKADLSTVRSQAEDSEFVNREMAEIEGNLEFELALGAATYADCFRGDMKARSLTGILVQMFQQLSVFLFSLLDRY